MSAEFDIPLDRIVIGKRLRPYDEANGALIAASMKAQGQLQAIEVSPAGKDRWHLVFGLHRIGAAKINGWTSLRGKKFEGDADARELREIEENFARHDLNALDRAVAVRRWFHHQGALRPSATGLPADKNLIKKQCFGTVQKRLTAQIAEKVGLSEASIYRDLKIAEGIAEFQDQLVGHPIADDHGQLKRLAALSPTERRQAVKGIVAGVAFNEVLAKLPSKKAGAQAQPKDKHLSALMAAWNKAPKSTKAAFIKAKQREIADLLDNGATR